MRTSGSKSCCRRRAGLACAVLALAIAGCVSTGAGPRSDAQQTLVAYSEELSEPLQATVREGTMLGGLLGGLSVGIGGSSFGVNDQNRGSSIAIGTGTGMVAGNLAGRYVAAKQQRYGRELDVIEAMTADVRAKNAQAGRTIEAMEAVVAEDRARLAELRAAVEAGQARGSALEAQLASVAADLETMQDATLAAQGHLDTFVEARSIVLRQSGDPALAGRQETRAMDREIETLRQRIGAMNALVRDLTEET